MLAALIANALAAGAGMPGSKAEAQPEAELAFVEILSRQVLRGRDNRVATQVTNGPVGIQRKIRRIGAGIREMRRVGKIERLHAELNPPALLDRKLAAHAAIEASQDRTAQP